MQILEVAHTAPQALQNSVIAIGNFDGVHRGHQQLLNIAAEQAVLENRPWGIVTFEPHPRSFFKPDEPVFRLTPRLMKERLAKVLGADFIIHLPFDKALAGLEADDFIEQHLCAQLKASHVISGYDFHFGKGRKGNPSTLQEAGLRKGFNVTIVDQVSDEGDGRAPFSSSSIRDSLRRGHLGAAARQLGYRWMIMGEVVEGDKRGRELGFPTVNISLEQGAEPFRGIYAVRVRDKSQHVRHPEMVWAGAGYFGDRPTFATNRSFLEVHLFDVALKLYGHLLQVEFVELIRPDQRFASTDQLLNQMKLDCDVARHILSKPSEPASDSILAQAQVSGNI